MQKVAYRFDSKTGLYVGPISRQPCKVRVGEYLTPGSSTLVQPPAPVDGRSIYWNGERWEYRAAIVPVEKPVHVVEKVPEVRENPELLKQVVANERMILKIEMSKDAAVLRSELLKIVSDFESRLNSFGVGLDGVRVAVGDLSNGNLSLFGAIHAVDSELESLKPVIESMISRVGEFDLKVSEFERRMMIVENKLGLEPMVPVDAGVKSSELISAAVPTQKSKWKFWS